MTDVTMERPLHDDVLYGAGAIAAFIYGSPKYRRRVYHLIEKNELPIFRWGNVVCARKSTLLTRIEQQEKQAVKSSEAA
jgi:hypothetical protein